MIKELIAPIIMYSVYFQICFLNQLIVFILFRYNLHNCKVFGFKYIISGILDCFVIILNSYFILDFLYNSEALHVFFKSNSNNTSSELFFEESNFSSLLIL